MGCCNSTTSSPYSSPNPSSAVLPNSTNITALGHDSSINQPIRSLSAAESVHESIPRERPNQPIRPPTPLATSPSHVSKDPPPWTRQQLEREREAFFDTRVSGHDEVWKAVRVVCEMLRRGDIAEAQGILDAMNMTCPTGRVARGRGRHREKGGVYDERGELYDIPSWVLIDPADIVEDEDEEKEGAEGGEDDPATRGLATVEKGKGRAEDIGEVVQIRARLSDRGTDVVVSAGLKQKVAVVVRSIQERVGVKRVRLMYLGKALDERSMLGECGWRQGHVVNAMVFEGDEKMLSKLASR